MAISNPKLLRTLPLLLSFIALFLQVHSQDHIDFQIDTFPTNPSSQNLIYQRDAHVPSDSSFLRLTRTDSSGNPQSGSIGRVLYSTPVQFWQPGRQIRQSTFETTIRFFITPPSNNNPADGIAFFIAPVNSSVGASGGSLGIFNSAGTASNVFAVEFDVYVNSAYEPNYRHIGINLNSRTSVNTTRFDNALSQVVTARINYDANTRRISVVATVGSQTYSLSYVRDLKTILTPQVQVGISSATGQEVAVFDVLSWYFSSTLVWDANSENDAKYIKRYV